MRRHLLVLSIAVACALAWAPAALAAPSTPTGLTAASPTNTRPSLSWNAAANGTGSVTYDVWRGATKLTATPISVRTYIDSSVSLTQGSSSYTVTATDSTGTSAASSATTVVYDTIAPPVPTTLSAVTPTNAKPALSWVSGGNDATSGFVNYQVYRGATLVGSPTATTFIDSALVTSGSQSYTVRSVDAAGNVSAGSAAKAVVYDTVIPSAPVLTAPVATNGSSTLTWTASSDTGGSTLTGYVIYRDGVLIGAPSPATALTYTDTSAMSPGSYVYTVYAHDGAGNSSLASNARTVIYDVTPPGTATGLAAPSPTNAKPTLIWTGTTDTGGSNIQRYDVYRTPPGGSPTLAGSTAVASFTDAAVTQSGIYAYEVRAVDGAGNVGAASSSTSVTYDNVAPSAPASVNGTTPTASPPVITWTASTDALSGVDHYDVLRGGTKINASPLTTLTYTDTSPIAGSQTYAVRSVDAAGNISTASVAKIIVYDPNPPTAPSLSAPVATSVDPALTWTASTDTGGSGLVGYRVYRDGTLITTTPPSTSYTDSDSAVVPGTYVYSVVAFDGAGNTSSSAVRTVIVDTSAPTAPGSVAATTPTNAKPVISWAAASDGSGTSSSGIVRYDVYRGAVLAGNSTSLTFTDAGATANSTLGYTVVAVDAAANRSVASNAVSVLYDTTSPPIPTNIGGTTPTATAPVVTWTSGGADNLSGLAYYAVYRGSTLVCSTSSLSCTDTMLATAGAQAYTVKAVDLAGNLSAATNARSIVFDPTAPGQPGKPTIASPAHAPALTWSAATDTGGSNIARYDIYRTPLGGAATLVGSSAGATFTDSSVSLDGSYSYDVVAVDGAGNQSAHSAGTTVSVDVTPPDAPANLTAQAALTASKPSLSWQLSSDNGGSGIAQYVIYRGGVQAGVSTGTTFVDTTVATNGSYSYTVKAVDAAGNLSAASAPITVTWDSTAPPVPISLTATTPTSAAPALSWQSGGAAADFDHYDLYRGSTLVWSGAASSYTDDQPPPAASGNLSYTVKAVDTLGNASSASTPKSILYDITPPGAVTSLTATSPIVHPSLSWPSTTDSGGSGLAGYRVYRDGSQVAQTTTLSFLDASLSVDGTYGYVVRALDGAGNVGPPSPTRTIQVDQTPPPAPTGIIAASPTNQVSLSWPATSDTGGSGSGVARYRVYRNGAPIDLTAPAAYSDTTLGVEGTWQYSVAAIDSAGNEGPQSAPVAVLYDRTPPPAPSGLSVPPITTTQPTLVWVAGGPDALSGFDHFELLRDGNLVASTAGTSITDVGLTANGSHTYAVRSVDAAGNQSAPTPVQRSIFDNTPPEIPTNVAAASPTNRPNLTWTTSIDSGGSAGVVYSILRDGSSSPIATTSGTSFLDTSALAEGAHTYAIVATDAAGNASAQSLPASVTVDSTPPDPVGTPTGATPTVRPALAWDPASDPSGIARYDVYRDTSLVGSSVTPSFIDSAIATDGSYAYTVVAVDNAGNRALASAPLSIVFDHTPPPAPSIAQGATPTGSLPNLSWTSGGADALSGFDHYIVFRDGVAVGTPTTSTFFDATLATLGPHVYVVRTVDVAGNVSAASPPRTVIYDTQPPPTPTDITVPTPTNAPALTWTASNDDSTGGSGVVGYRIYRDGQLIATPSSPTFADGSLSISGSHAYWVTSIDAVGNESPASPTKVVSVDLDPPLAPPDLSAVSPTQRPSLTWGASTDVGPGSIAIDHYNVYRDGVLIAKSTATSYVDARLAVSGQVTYTVRAVDLAGNVGPPSAPAPVTIDVTGPSLQSLSIPHERTVGAQVVFSVAAVDPQGSAVAAPVWTFGDGGASGSTVTHTFNTPGVYSVTVSATDALGNMTSSSPTTITVVARPTIVQKASIKAPPPVRLKALRTGGWRVQAAVTLTLGTNVTVRLGAGSKTVGHTGRNVPNGTTPIFMTIPKRYRKKGTLTLTLRIAGVDVQTVTFRVR